MLYEYDFSHARKNPYAKLLKKQITINIDVSTVDYFKDMSSDNGIPYQTLINLYLRDCVENERKIRINFNWYSCFVAKKERRALWKSPPRVFASKLCWD